MNIKEILVRYLILVAVAIPNLYIFYLVFTPLTIYPVYFLLNLFFKVSLINTTLLINNLSIKLISACIAGSAYYFLLILNLSTPKIKTNKRIKMIFWAFFFLLIVNILRIFFLSILAINDFSFFDITHKIFWYFLSIIFVIGIWFTQVKLFKIRKIPFYSDIKQIYISIKNDRIFK